ncbi:MULTISPECIES: phosphate signaling complex protein PhoU [Carnobacterium]|uniref:Phosphate-specific transport system accessory protein PhoU n=2 Tax=Carnobacterium inhibens TaxID=147709 RepID=U5S725_9LACT|nr:MULTISPECIES: phosphate signaling complex protein PhoU [Carnobacterium]AGY81014.1 PhoU family transcriptional regulator [Carnobacterium inhibens subsp. gilichinskyi]MBC9825755.1 phosphate signaling complex protein PhoU [Carnobacterium inhibens]MCM3513476.1 phosphate signaling complex protein PhoU [Carnobacterium inhibens]MDN5372355.1 phosphate transport system protein [Carnobacterium sp.]
MRKIYEEELANLHVHFSEMGMMVNEAIYKSVKAFTNHDKELAQQVIENDVVINARETELEKKCFELIALQQPVTSDLRKIVTVMKASADLERMGDHAVSVAKSTIRVKGTKRVPQVEADIAQLSEKVKVMVEGVLEAYIKEDANKAKELATAINDIDNEFYAIYQQCIDEMKVDSELVLGATDYMLVARYLKRIGDYVTNICEWIVYLKTGKVVELNTSKK